MPIKIDQPNDLEPGHVRLSSPAFAKLQPGRVEVRVARMDTGAPRFLDPRGAGDQAWGAAELWFETEAPFDGDGIVFGPTATWHLRPHMAYMATFRDAAGTSIEEPMSWRPIRLPSDAPSPKPSGAVVDAPPKAAPAPDPIPEPEPEPEPTEVDPLDHFAQMAAEAAPPPAPQPTPPPPSQRSRTGLWLTMAALIVLAGGAVGYLGFIDPGWFIGGNATPPIIAADPTPETEPTIALTVDGARGYLQGKPDPADAATEAKRFADAGQPEAAFLLDSYAARAGDTTAGIRMGNRYNPETWTAAPPKAPDPDRAAGFYQGAAEAGDGKAMLKLGQLLKSGKVSRDDAPEQAQFWLKKAEAAGEKEPE